MEKRFEKKIKKIVIIGPESTGKTELAMFLAAKFDTVYVPEYARKYVEKLNHPYTYKDIEIIAKKQIELDNEYSAKANKILFFDTYLIITKIWFKVVYNKIPNWLDNAIINSNIDFFLLCNTEIPWIPDKVRENGGEMREKLFGMYENEIRQYGFKYGIVKGTGEYRFDNALEQVKNYIK